MAGAGTRRSLVGLNPQKLTIREKLADEKLTIRAKIAL